MYIAAKGNFSPRESIKKIIKMPTVRAFLLGIFANLIHIKLPDSYMTNI